MTEQGFCFLGEPNVLLTHEMSLGIGFIPTDEDEQDPGGEGFITSPILHGLLADHLEEMFGGEDEKTNQQISMAAHRLLFDHLQFGHDDDVITDGLMNVAKMFIIGGVEGLMVVFQKNINDVLKFIERLRIHLGMQYKGKRIKKHNLEMNSQIREVIMKSRGPECDVLRKVLFE